MFRRIYWITERLHKDGASEATGIYTSIYDLVTRGLPRHPDGLRLTIAKVDAEEDPTARYVSPDFAALDGDLEPYVRSGEITEEQRRMLRDALDAR